MEKLFYGRNIEAPANVWTFAELLTFVDDTRNVQKLPSARDLRMHAEKLVLCRLDDCTLEVYRCVYFIYSIGKRSTVQSIHRCLNPIRYESCDPASEAAINAHQFLDQPFYLRLILDGEERIFANQQSQDAKKAIYTDGINMESAYLRDPDSDFVSQLLIQEEQQSRLHQLSHALSNLTDRQRIAFIQYYAEGKTYQEIADAMGCTKQTVYESVQRALTRMRVFFKEN